MQTQLPWFVSGPALGLLVIAGYWAHNQALGGVGSFAALNRYLAAPRQGAGWRLYFLGGLIAGGLAFSALSGGPWATFDYGGLGAHTSLLWKAAALGAGGALMGAGAKWAGGCTLGHGLCGSATGSPSSFAATAVFMGSAVAVSQALVALGVLG